MRARSAGLIGALAASGMLLAGCGDEPAAGGSPSTAPTTTPTTTASTPTVPPDTPTPAPTAATSKPATPLPTTKPVVLSDTMLLTGGQVARADAGRGWRAGGGIDEPYCGPKSTAGTGAVKTAKRFFNNELDASGGQWLTAYRDVKAAQAAYDAILATIKSCPAGKPVSTHARKITENRGIAAGDSTWIVRWYDYPLPSDPGSEDGGFPHAVTRSGTIVSVIVFGEMGRGVKPANFEKLARTAAGKLS